LHIALRRIDSFNLNDVNMKKGIIVMMLMLSGLTGFAQTEKGNFLLSAGTSIGVGDSEGLMGLAFTNSKVEFDDGNISETKLTNFYVSTKAGFFLIDNLAIGLDLATSLSSGSTDVLTINLETKTNFFGVGPFLRYYLGNGKIMPFAEVNTLFGSRNENSQGAGTDSESKFSVANIGAGVGIAIFLGDRSALDLGASYNSTSLKEREDAFNVTQNTLGLKIGFTVFF
jgi:hypothetical protein